jgi:6-phosphogluconolactonase
MLKVHLAALAVLCLAVTAFARPKGAPVAGKGPKKFLVYFGTYTGGKSKGIYRATLDLATGKLSKPVLAGEMVNPSFLAIHPSKRYLYAVGEVSRMGDRATGGVTAFAINAKTGNLKKLNSQPSGGAGPCHLVVDATGKYVLAANYGGGSVCVLPIEEGGKLGRRGRTPTR